MYTRAPWILPFVDSVLIAAELYYRAQLLLIFCIHRQYSDTDSENDMDTTIRPYNNPAYEKSIPSSPDKHTNTTSSDYQEHGYETVHYTRPDIDQSTMKQDEILHKIEHEYDMLDRGQKGHNTTARGAISKSLEQCQQHKTSLSEGRNKEMESAYSRLEDKKLDSKRSSKEHIYHVLIGPSK